MAILNKWDSFFVRCTRHKIILKLYTRLVGKPKSTEYNPLYHLLQHALGIIVLNKKTYIWCTLIVGGATHLTESYDTLSEMKEMKKDDNGNEPPLDRDLLSQCTAITEERLIEHLSCALHNKL